VVDEALMIEPTETESLETVDALADALLSIAALAVEDADALHRAPENTPVAHIDEAGAARRPVLSWFDEE
jgi:glycine dehydrogenase subunit 2